MSPAAAELPEDPPESPDWRTALLAGVPVAACLLIVGLPSLAQPRATAFRALYFVACLLWLPALVWLQRGLWRRRLRPWPSVLVLLAASYVMSVINSAAGSLLAREMGWGRGWFTPLGLVSGLDGCWLALIAYCAAHAVVAHAQSLRSARQQHQQALLLAREAELRALRQQLHPHFLFNTLNSISSLVQAQRSDEARTLIAQLADLLRMSLQTEAHEVALAEELALTECYLGIEQRRLGERLQLHWNIGNGTLDACVPFLLLQPLVENAVHHALSRRRRPGRLQISVRREAGQLLIDVANDPADDAASEDAGLRIGQDNIARRLAQLHPGRHRFSAGVDAHGLYRVHIELPWQLAVAA